MNDFNYKYIPDDPIVYRFDYRYIKRLMDIVGSFLLLILFIPIYIVIAIFVKADSPGPILYEWNTTGKNGTPFKGWKFRTMVPNAEQIKVKLEDKNEMVGPVFKIKDDPRITRIGKFLRKYSFDESIQFYCVLKGDMSLVGPRPAGAFELVNYKEWQRRRMSVMAGLTGPWQVSGRNKINNFDDWVKLDLNYIDNWSLWLDVKILFKTIPAAFRGTGM